MLAALGACEGPFLGSHRKREPSTAPNKPKNLPFSLSGAPPVMRVTCSWPDSQPALHLHVNSNAIYLRSGFVSSSSIFLSSLIKVSLLLLPSLSVRVFLVANKAPPSPPPPLILHAQYLPIERRELRLQTDYARRLNSEFAAQNGVHNLKHQIQIQVGALVLVLGSPSNDALAFSKGS